MGRVVNVVFELLGVWRWEGRELLIGVGWEVVRVVRSVPHERRGVRVVRPGETSQR